MIMRNIKEQTESIQLGIYCDIICGILQSHENLSICKTLTFSYLIKQNKFLGGTIYTAKNTQDVVFKGVSLLSGDFDGFCNSVPYILKALHILISKNVVISENDMLKLTNSSLGFDLVYEESNFIKKAIEESKAMTDRQFLKEVTYNV